MQAWPELSPPETEGSKCWIQSTSGALAQEMVGDPAKGEELFTGQCGGCHVIQNEAGEVLSQGSQTDSNRDLYGIAGRVPGSLPDTFYSKLLSSYGESGAVWEEANFVAYVLDVNGRVKVSQRAAQNVATLGLA